MEHTELPYSLDLSPTEIILGWRDPRSNFIRVVATFDPEDLENAKFLERACNSHYDLLEACKRLLEDDTVRCYCDHMEQGQICSICMAHEAIAKAEGTE